MKHNLIKKLDELERNEYIYRAFGDIFAEIGVKEPQPQASEAFSKFGETHRSIEKSGQTMLSSIKPMISDLNTYLNKAIPDTKLTIKKYADVKFEYLSYCLKVKEMDDEEYTYQALQEPLYRVETGNYEYRLILRCRQDARSRFAKLRSDVMVKLELLDQKHVQDIVQQLQRLISSLSNFHNDCHFLLKDNTIFPIELDLSKTCTFQYPDPLVSPYQDEPDDDPDDDVPPLDTTLVQGLEAKPSEIFKTLSPKVKTDPTMTRHARNNTAGAVYSYHERQRDAGTSGYGTQRLRLSKDAIKDFDACNLTLQPARHPVLTPEGFLYDKESILEYIIHQKRENARKLKEYERQKKREESDAIEAVNIEHSIKTLNFLKTETTIVNAGSRRQSSAPSSSSSASVGEVTSSVGSGISNMTSGRDKGLPSFWVPSMTPQSSKTK
ncbi:unnamed protein product, partial [Medioppia subpectinata]